MVVCSGSAGQWCRGAVCSAGAPERCGVHGAPPHCSALLRTVLRVVTDGEKAHDGKFDRIEAVDT